MAAKNSIGVGAFAQLDNIEAKLPFGVPGPPESLRIREMTRNSIVLTWEQPDFDGGAPLTGYYVEKRQGFSSRWTKVNKMALTSPMFETRDLMEGEEYEFHVVAENEAGIGAPSNSTGSFKAKDPYGKPNAPGTPTVNIDKGEASLSWAKPSSDGGSPITNYVIEMKEMGEVKWSQVTMGEKVTKTSYTVQALRSDTDYEFRVFAQNKAGLSQPSKSSGLVRYGKQRILYLYNIIIFNIKYFIILKILLIS